MSNFKTQDVVFGRSLRDPDYRVDFAVGTTYSLDLDTFISLPFSLGFLEEPDEVMKKSVAYIFSALRLCSDRLAVFCNFSDIKVPPQTRKVYYALMEGSVFSINASRRKNQIVNFHPKVWVVKESSLTGDAKVKVIVMSRNLTKDGSLDCVCVLDGHVGDKPASKAAQAKHEPLCAFLEYLGSKADSRKRTKIGHLIEDIRCIRAFETEGSAYDDYDLLPMGIPDYSGVETLQELTTESRDAVIVSPFLDDKTLESFSTVRNRFLLTREDSITEKAVELFGQENIWTMNPQMIDNDLDESVDLHAKMYFSTPRENSEHYLYLGSTNATQGGFDRNVEFLLRLRFRPNRTSFYDFRSYFTDDAEKRFSQMVGLPAGASDAQLEYQQSLALRRVVASIKDATVMLDEQKEGRYSVALRLASCGDAATIYPLMRPDLKSELTSGQVCFEGLSLIELTEFYVVECEGLSRVVKIPTRGIPSERDDEICRQVIGSRSQFMDCISFLLSESKASYVIDRAMSSSLPTGSGEGEGEDAAFAAVYESMLRQAYEDPDTFDDIRTFVDSLPADVVPEEFDSLYRMMCKAVKSVRR
jgi:hypothetical protein